MNRLNNKVALVTGGASGIGKAIAQRLVAEGASVVITDVQAPVGQAVAAEFGFTFFEQDVTDELQWQRLMVKIQERHGGLHILVNNAGILGPRDAMSLTDARMADWRAIFAVNVEGVFLGCRAAMSTIHASGGGSIINIASTAGLLATPHAVAYGASKAAVRHITKSVAQHCVEKKLKVRCNSVHPGDVRAPMFEATTLEDARRRGVSLETRIKELESIVPMARFTASEDVANAVAFLASEESRQMTGEKMVIDGGAVYCDTYHRRVLRGEVSAAV